MSSRDTPNSHTEADPIEDVCDRSSRAQFRALSRREQEVATLLGIDLGYHAMAGQLGGSRETVRRHVKHIFEKLGVRSRHESATRAAATNQGKQ
jgi:DNA-binding CsgD family transcriptional regulator